MISPNAWQFAVPQMVRVDDSLIFAWTEIHDDVERIASAKLAIEALDK